MLAKVCQCPICQNESMFLIESDKKDIKLQRFAESMKQEFPRQLFDDPRPQYRPLNYYIQAFNMTRHFINITTESIDTFFLGMLAMKFYQSDIEIHVAVWHPQKIYPKLRRLMDHSIFLKQYKGAIRPFARGIKIDTISETHQKLIVLDGAIAFHGSMNASFDGWTRDGEMPRFETDRDEIESLNRTFFSKYMVKKRNKSNV